MNLDRFYLIIDHPDWLRRLLPLGVKMVQLRCKELPSETVRGYCLLYTSDAADE